MRLVSKSLVVALAVLAGAAALSSVAPASATTYHHTWSWGSTLDNVRAR